MVAQRDEESRLRALSDSGVLDSTPDPIFDEIAGIAAAVAQKAVALIGFLDADSEWIMARHGWNVASIPRSMSFAVHTVAQREVLVVADTLEDARFLENPLVSGSPAIRSYAGAPIVTSSGHSIGTLEVFDRRPGSLSASEVEVLQLLARLVTREIELRARLRALETRLHDSDEMRLALRESEERFRDVFESSDDLIMTIRADGRMMHVNGACIDLLGTFARDLGKMTVWDVVHPDELPEFRASFDQVVETGRQQRVETVFLTSLGRKMTVDGSLLPKVIDGRTVLVRVIFRDISDRKQYEIDLGRARDAALEAARAKSTFLQNITHEIRTPMNVMLGMIELLLGTSLTDEQRTFAEAAQASAESFLGVMNNIIHVARLESGSLTLAANDFDLRTTLVRMVEVMTLLAQEKELEIELDVDDTIPPVLRGDSARLRQVVNNLISNAIKFTSQGRILVTAAREKETDTHLIIRVAVTDPGAGIPEASLPHVFEPFYQVDASSTREQGGTGLGLSICRELVELMGGAIGVESRRGEGSTFWFSVPFEKRTSEGAALTDRKSALAGARALVLDRSETSRRIVEHYLGGWGIRARFADNCADALERLRNASTTSDPYRFVVFDLHMPDMNGLTFARAIKRDPGLGAIALIMLTSLGEKIDDSVAREAGVNAYLQKPVDQLQLFDAIAQASPLRLETEPRAQPKEAPPVSEAQRRNARILLAEDKLLNQRLTLAQLQKLGYKADVVSNGAEALKAVTEGAYDIVLMDCQMPVLDGYQATMEIRRQHLTRQPRIIALTAHAVEGDREKCLAAGMDDYLSKPTRQTDLAAALARAIAAS